MNLIPIFRLITLRNAAVALALAITGAVDASGQITVKGSGMNILDAIKLIEKDSGYTFYFNADDLSGLPALTFNCSGDINKVLDCMFAGSGIDWQVRGNEVSLTKKANVSKNETVRKRMVSGTVLDGSNDEPLIGAVVNVKDTKTNVATDIDGHFDVSFTGNSCTLEISYVGYAKQSVYITDQGTVAVKMQPANEMLGEVVVVGAGTQKKISVTGAIATVKGAEFRAPSSNLTNNLAGKLAGVIAVTNSGEPGSGSSFYIRGINTFGGRTAPLILLDGVEISANDLNNIPPENIESFSILKDASATAIYGARGANGVMLVTTKNGEENTKARISVTYEHSLLQPVNMVEYVDGATYMETYNEAQRMRLGDVTPKYSWERIDNTRAGINQYLYPDVDWRGLMMKKLTQSQRANVNITGGGSRVTYYMSLQMNHDSGALDVPKNYSLNNNHNLWRYIFQNNIEYKVTSSTKLGMRINAQIAHQTSPNTSSSEIFQQVQYNNPVDYPAVYPDDGSGHLKFGSDIISSGSYFTNPYANMLNSFKEANENKLNVSVNLDQKLDFVTKGLSLTALVNFNSWYYSSYTRSLKPYYYRVLPGSYNPAADTYALEQLQKGEDFINESSIYKTGDNLFYFDARVNYNRTFGPHSVTGMLMYMMRENRTNILPSRNQGFSGRATYDYDHRYLVEFNFGYNGTERLAKDDRFEFFPAASIGWVISNETFWEPLNRIVTHMKVRSSYGLVGSDETGVNAGAPYYMYKYGVALYGKDQFGRTFFKTGQTPSNAFEGSGPEITDYPVVNGSWERSKQFDVGVDLRLFDQVAITFDYFNYKRDRILLQRASFPSIMGYQGVKPWVNMGKVDNRGFELSVNWIKRLTKDLSIDLRGNFTYAENKLVYKDEPDYPYTWQVETGKPLGATYGFIADGLFKDQADIDNHADQSFFGSTVMPGDIKYRDVNGDGKISSEDRVMLSPYGNQPRIQYGFGVSVQWRDFDLSVFFNGSAQRRIMLDPAQLQPFNQMWTADRNLMTWIADNHWVEGGDNSNVEWPRLGTLQAQYENNLNASSFWMKKADFIRFKTLEVGYNWKFLRVYFSGDNLAVWSPFKYWDPELDYNTYPLSRTFNLGVQFHF